MMLEIFYCKYHKHEHLNSNRVPGLVVDFVSNHHIQPVHMNDNDVASDQQCPMRLFRSNHSIAPVVQDLMSLSSHLISNPQHFQTVLCIHSRNLLHDLCLAPNMTVELNLLLSLKINGMPCLLFNSYWFENWMNCVFYLLDIQAQMQQKSAYCRPPHRIFVHEYLGRLSLH